MSAGRGSPIVVRSNLTSTMTTRLLCIIPNITRDMLIQVELIQYQLSHQRKADKLIRSTYQSVMIYHLKHVEFRDKLIFSDTKKRHFQSCNAIFIRPNQVVDRYTPARRAAPHGSPAARRESPHRNRLSGERVAGIVLLHESMKV